MERLGTVSFQAQDKSDIFLIADVQEAGIELSDESLVLVEDPQFDSEKAWVTGKVPKFTAVDVDGDNAVITAWFKGERFEKEFTIIVYLEYEEAEVLMEVVADQLANEKPEQPKEVYL